MKDYNQLISSSSVVLVEFYADWCPHCQRMMPIVEDLKELLQGRAPVYQFEIDHNKELAQSQNVDSIPTFIIYKDGEEVWRYTGEIDGNVLYGKVESQL